MRKYYYSNGNGRKGPVTLEELKLSKGLRRKTLVWHDGLNAWTHASDVSELSDAVPPAVIGFGMGCTVVPPSSRVEREMFTDSFSFVGRIRRLEFALSIIISLCVGVLSYLILGKSNTLTAGLISLLISAINYWFIFAQSAKRCHDIGKSGWWQLIPFYQIYLLFLEGDLGDNEYGFDPRSDLSESQKASLMSVAIMTGAIALAVTTATVVKISGYVADRSFNMDQFFGLSSAEKEELRKILREE
jgi:uncharacterized membrane protein YhaH (DUF805 family)